MTPEKSPERLRRNWVLGLGSWVVLGLEFRVLGVLGFWACFGLWVSGLGFWVISEGARITVHLEKQGWGDLSGCKDAYSGLVFGG